MGETLVIYANYMEVNDKLAKNGIRLMDFGTVNWFTLCVKTVILNWNVLVHYYTAAFRKIDLLSN